MHNLPTVKYGNNVKSVEYLGQQMGAASAQPVCWLKYTFSPFLQQNDMKIKGKAVKIENEMKINKFIGWLVTSCYILS